jgi:prepilin-type N-terminal cleavage/methylation domain-containing protein
VPSDRADERGFTLLEMMVAVLIMAVAFTPLAAVFWNGFQTADASAHRTSGFTIATREIEKLRAVPYSVLGFYSDQSPPTWSTDTTVLLGSCSSACGITPLVVPTSTDTAGGLTYTITRYIYWDSAAAVSPPAAAAPAVTTDTQAYKGATVVVSWTDRVGVHTVEQDSIIYPGGQGPYTGPGTSSSTTSTTAAVAAPATPSQAPSLEATQPPASPEVDNQEIDVSVAAVTGGGPAQDYYLQYSTDPTFPAGDIGQVDYPVTPGTDIPVQGLAASTTYYFRYYATNSAGQSGYSPSLQAATPAPSSATTTTATTTPGSTTTTTVPQTTTTTLPCALGSFTISTKTSGKTYLTQSGAMSENVGLSLNVSGACNATLSVVSTAPGGNADPSSPYLLAGPAGGGQWTGLIGSYHSTSWALGTHNMVVYLNGTPTSVAHGLLVCTYTVPGHRSSSPTTC